MRILVVSQYFWPENFRINDLVAELVGRGHSVTVLTGKPNYPSGNIHPEFKKNPGAFTQYHGANLIRAPMLVRAQGSVRLFMNYISFVFGASVWGIWKLRHDKFDVIFICGLSPVTLALPGILISKIKKTPTVFWVLDLWPESLRAVGVIRSPRVLGWVGHLVRFIYNRCTLILGQSRGFIGNISKYCAAPEKIRYFPSWAESIFSSNGVEPAPEVPTGDGLFNILFAGNIGESQDMPAVLNAAERLKDDPRIRWLILGDGRKSEWLAQEIGRRKLQERVVLLGRHPVERMPSFYVHADALLVSLKHDPAFSLTIPAKLQSYLVAGIPVLGMLDGEGAATIEQANAGFTCPAGDAAGLADAAMKLADMSRQERAAMGERGRRYAQTEFGREMLMDRLEAFFQEAISASATRAAR
ncbi:MAG: glycosyltransferase family 4 protein [Betaproteobacteria bacterium]|nr:glycosyltransferase family 4 protein [Betaproteobacteria bacterium]